MSDRTDTNGSEQLISATPWMVGVFCDDCARPWTQTAPCRHCGKYSQPEARTYRRVVRGTPVRVWEWRRGYEFSDEGSAVRQGEAPEEAPQEAIAV